MPLPIPLRLGVDQRFVVLLERKKSLNLLIIKLQLTILWIFFLFLLCFVGPPS